MKKYNHKYQNRDIENQTNTEYNHSTEYDIDDKEIDIDEILK